MARHVEGPWYRKAKDTWYATLGGRKASLGVRGRENRRAAVAAWHRLMAGGDSAPAAQTRPDFARVGKTPAPPPTAPVPTVCELADLFLADAETRLKPATIRLYRGDLGCLCRAHGATPADRLTPLDLSRWLASLALNPTTKAMTLRAVAACLNWAVRADLIPSNPARRVPKPKGRSRSADSVLSGDDHERLLRAATPDFRLVLRVLHGTGCRPGEACGITSETFDPAAGVVILPVHKTDRTGRPRLIFPPPDVCELLSAQLARYGSGPLLRSRKGKPYTARAITKAFQYLRLKTGVRAIAYGYRHTFATDALVKGVPDAQVAALMGHADTTMLHRHYSHLGQRADVLKEAAARVRG